MYTKDIFIKMKLPNCKMTNIYFYNRYCLLTVTVHSSSVSNIMVLNRFANRWTSCCGFFFFPHPFRDSEMAVRIQQCMTYFYCNTLLGAFWHPAYFSHQYLGKSSACILILEVIVFLYLFYRQMKNDGGGAAPFYIVTFNLFLFICCKLYMLSVGFGQTQGRRDFTGLIHPKSFNQ